MIAALHTSGLAFDEATHTYRVDGREIPSVTQVLADNRLRPDFSRVPPDVLDRARQRGTAVHLATHYHDEGSLDPTTVDAVVVPYLDAWLQFLHERRVRILELEKRYAHSTLGYAGMIDRIALVDVGGRERRCVLDIKTGDPSGAEYQTAAYAELYRDAGHVSSLPPERWSVQLHPDRPIPYTVTPYRELRDWRIFRAALDLTHARAAQGQSWREAA